VVIGPGPLALGADVASGIPADAATRAGRALALQALGVELALVDGLAADRLMLGAVPDWAAGDGDASSILVQSWLRSALFPGHRLVVGGAAGWIASGRSAAAVAALSGAPLSLVLEPSAAGKVPSIAAELAAAAGAAGAVRASLGDGAIHGEAAEFAARTLRAAAGTLERLAAEGWESLLGPAGGDADSDRLGGSAVVERATGPGSSERLLRDLV
jgi:hypothetical protein